MCMHPCTHCHTEWRSMAEWFIAEYTRAYNVTRDIALQDYEEARSERQD
jgi:hypothetical protein